MRFLLIFLAALLLSVGAYAQPYPTPTYQNMTIFGNGQIYEGTWNSGTRPACSVAGSTGYSTTTGSLEFCNGSVWIDVAASGGVTGPGVSTNGFVPTWSGTTGSALGIGLPTGTTGSSTIIQTSGAGLLAPSILPLATTGAFGAVKPDGTSIHVAGGVISATGSITGITAGTGLSGGGSSGNVTLSIANTAVTSGSYGGPSNLPGFTVSPRGQLIAATNTTLPIVYASAGLVCNNSGAASANTSYLNGLLATANTHILLPNCQIDFNGQLTMNTANVWLDGQGADGTTLSFSQSSGSLIVMGNLTGVGIEAAWITNLLISDSSSGNSTTDIYQEACTYCRISFVHLGGFINNGIVKDGVPGDFANYVDHVVTEGIGFCTGTCLLVGPNSNNTNQVVDFWVEDSYFGGGYGGIAIQLQECSACYFLRANGVQANIGMEMVPGGSQTVWVWATDVLLDGNVNYGLLVDPQGGAVAKSDMGNLWVSFTGMVPGHTASGANGIYFSNSGGYIKGMTFEGCRVLDNAGQGVNSDTTGGTAVAFTGCMIGGNGQMNTSSRVPNIALNGGSHYSIVGGAVGGNANDITEQANYGVACTGSTDYVTIQGVDLTGNVTGEQIGCNGVSHPNLGNNLCTNPADAGCSGGGGGGGGVTSWNGQTGAVSNGISTAGGNGNNIMVCNNSGCTQAVGTSCDAGTINTDGHFFIGCGGSAWDLGTSTFPWNDILGAQVDINVGNYYTALNCMPGCTFTNTSDGRLKDHVEATDLSLDFINRLRPVSYQFRVSDLVNSETAKIVHQGFIAQEVETALDGHPFAGLVKPTKPDDYYKLNYIEFIPPIVKSVQDLDAKVDAMKNQQANPVYIWFANGGAALLFLVVFTLWRGRRVTRV